jgi:hypothetical protein
MLQTSKAEKWSFLGISPDTVAKFGTHIPVRANPPSFPLALLTVAFQSLDSILVESKKLGQVFEDVPVIGRKLVFLQANPGLLGRLSEIPCPPRSVVLLPLLTMFQDELFDEWSKNDGASDHV